MTLPRAVAIVTSADTVSAAIGSARMLRHSLPPSCDIVFAYSAAPAGVSERVRAAAGNRPIEIRESAAWHSQHEARNRALAGLPPYDFYLFLDLDSRIGPGTLERCIETLERTGADFVGGVILYAPTIDFGRKGEKIIHYAGGESLFRPDADGRPGMEEIHHWVGVPLDQMREQIGTEPFPCDQVEFHGMCMTRRAVEALTPFDPELLVMEPSDLALRARQQGFRGVMDPMIEVSYEAAAEFLCDLPAYSAQWGRDAVQDSVRYFARKYGLPEDGEVVAHQTRWNRQHHEDIGVVVRAGHPAPALVDLHAHPFAQTWPQLLQQLRRQGWSVAEIAHIKRCHDAGRDLANGFYRACGKPFIAHLVGTASVLAAYGAPPILVESGLVHAAYGTLGASDEDSGRALAQRVGRNVDRVLRAYSRQHFHQLPIPQTEEEVAFYSLDDARALVLRVANEIEECLDGAGALAAKPRHDGPLVAHARKILPRLGFGDLLTALERALTLDRCLAGSMPEPLTDGRRQSYRLPNQVSPDRFALPDDKWVEVASFLRHEGRAPHVVAAPDEFRYLCNAIRREDLQDDPWARFGAEAVVVLHKGRLARHARPALAAAAAGTPIFANEVFVAYSKVGKAVPAANEIHLAPVRHAVTNGLG
jgi:hypothetical protein